MLEEKEKEEEQEQELSIYSNLEQSNRRIKSLGGLGSKSSNILSLFNDMTLHCLLQFCFRGVLEVKGSIEGVELATLFIEYMYLHNC